MVSWNQELEKLLAEEGEKALGSSWIHNECETYYSKCNQYITIPSIILSTVAGSASVGSQTLFQNTTAASVGIGLISIFVGVLQTLGSFWGFAKLQESHRNADIQWSKLHRFIAVEMSLPRRERMQARDMLKVCRDSIERLSENCPLVPYSIVVAFNNKFGKKYEDVAIPDMANGLKKIVINHTMSAETPRTELLFKKEPYTNSWAEPLTRVPSNIGSSVKAANPKSVAAPAQAAPAPAPAAPPAAPAQARVAASKPTEIVVTSSI